MALIENGHLKHISPITIFPFDEIVPALRFLRTGTHIGKLVISNGSSKVVEVPVS